MGDTPDLLALGGFVAVNFAAASSGAVFKPGPWYASLAKPSWTPPNWVFPLVWTLLFLMNATAGWLVYLEIGEVMALPLIVYGISLAVNAIWSGLFFGAKRMGWALVDVVALGATLLAQIILFARVDALAAYLTAPYLAWVSLAALLNWQMLRLNPRAV